MQLFLRALIAACVAILASAYAFGVNAAWSKEPYQATTFLDRTGLPLGTILASDQIHAVGVPLDRISPRFVSAIVDAEDAHFFQHGAVDVASLARAVRESFIYGQPRSGGSTIAMQLARLLHPEPSTIRGKLVQIARAERITARSSKRAILAAYINRVPMGGNLYGVEAAARAYFGESAADLDLAQATLLAAIPNDPARLAPDVNLAALRSRQRYVLDRMVAARDATREDADLAWAETLRIRRHDSGIDDAAHALFYLYPRVGARGGRVRTTIDRDLQRFAQAQTAQVVASLDRFHVTDAAVLVADNASGDVLAYVGSPDYFSDRELGRNDGVQALRQPGSSLKPFTYELALERRTIESTTILPDVPSTFAIPGGELYAPADYSGRFSGPVRVRYALANSLNVPAVRVLSDLGVAPLLERLHDLGFGHLDKAASYYGLGLTLGGGEVSLWELTHAFMTMARNGSAVPLRLLVTDSSQNVHQIGDAPVWSLVTDMLADAHARAKSFGVHSVLEMPFDAAVKTGTSSDFRDTWTVGYSREYTVGVWVGNFDGTAMHGVSGVTGAGPLWNRLMLHLHERADPPPFPAPQGYIRTRICAVTGHAPRPGCPAIVQEWVLPRDLAAVRHAVTPRLGSEYDTWLALQPLTVAQGSLRIVSPRDGDRFARVAPINTRQAREEAIALRASGTHGVVRWRVNGIPVAVDSDGIAFWPLALGTWTIEARDARSIARATIHVGPAPAHARPGFTRTSN